MGFLLCFAMGQNRISYFFYSFLYFWPSLGVSPYKPCKTSETPKLVEIVSIKPNLLSLVWILYRYWQLKLCNNDRQHLSILYDERYLWWVHVSGVDLGMPRRGEPSRRRCRRGTGCRLTPLEKMSCLVPLKTGMSREPDRRTLHTDHSFLNGWGDRC
jgi:hypothetical protein